MPKLALTKNELRNAEIKSNRKLLRKALSELTRTGWWTTMNYECCQTCLKDASPYDKPCLGFTKQDEKNIKIFGEVFLWHAGEAVFHDAETGDGLMGELAHRARAWEAVAVLRKHGLKVRWSGHLSDRICVRLDPDSDIDDASPEWRYSC